MQQYKKRVEIIQNLHSRAAASRRTGNPHKTPCSTALFCCFSSAPVETKRTIFHKFSRETCTFAASYGILNATSAPPLPFRGPAGRYFPRLRSFVFVFFDGCSFMRRDQIKQVHPGEKSTHGSAEAADQGRFGCVHSFLFSASATLAPRRAAALFCAFIFSLRSPGDLIPFCPVRNLPRRTYIPQLF